MVCGCMNRDIQSVAYIELQNEAVALSHTLSVVHDVLSSSLQKVSSSSL